MPTTTIPTPEQIVETADTVMISPTRLHFVLLMEQVAQIPDSVARFRQYADAQADDEDYRLFHYGADMLVCIQDGTYDLPLWPDYQAPPRRRTTQEDASMTSTPPATPTTPATRELSADERHAQGRALLATAFQEPTAKAAYQRILDLSEAGTIDRALGTLALHTATVHHGTTIHLEMSESAAMHILNTLLVDMEQWGPSNLPNGLPDETTLGQLADHATAITELANALIDPSLDLESRQKAAWEEQRAAAKERAAHAPRRRLRTIKPSTIDHMKALRAEFADDPKGFDFLLDLMGTLTPSSEQETPAPATPEPAPA